MPIVYKKFPTWEGLLAHMTDDQRRFSGLYYQASLDFCPTPIVVLRLFKNSKLRIQPLHGTDAHTVDASHLDRFSYETYEPAPFSEDDFRCPVHSNGGTGRCCYCEDSEDE